MCNILMSIKPQYVEKILSGNKKYEYRKKDLRRAAGWKSRGTVYHSK